MASKRQKPTLEGFSKRGRPHSEGETTAGSEARIEDSGESGEQLATEEIRRVPAALVVRDIGHHLSSGKRPAHRQLYELLTGNHPVIISFPIRHIWRKVRWRPFPQADRSAKLCISRESSGLFCLHCIFFATNLDINSKKGASGQAREEACDSLRQVARERRPPNLPLRRQLPPCS